MRRSVTVVGLVLAVLLAVGGCSDDSPDDAATTSTEPDTTVEPIDSDAATERLHTVCRRSVAEARYDDCVAAADAAVSGATDAGCPATALDAWAEHVVATGFDSTPHDGFFESCPVPLSNLMLPGAPAPYRPALGQRGTGLLDQAEVAAAFVASPEVEAFLDEIGHQLSYAAAWVDGDNLVLVRLDRFEGPDQAAAFLDSEHRAISQEDSNAGDRQIPGILQSRVVAQDGLHLVTGRVCEVAMTLIAQAGDGQGLTTDDVVAWFSDQARRVQTVASC